MIQNPNILLPKWISNKAIMVYFIALAVSSAMYTNYILPWYYILAGAVAVIGFFYYGKNLSRQWGIDKIHNARRFEKKLFWTAFVIRAIYVVIIYVVFQNAYGDAFGFENADAVFYNDSGKVAADELRAGRFHLYDAININGGGKVDISDAGYAIYLGIVYFFTGNSILIARFIKCLLSAFTVVLVYRLAVRNFGEQTARMAGILCMLWPNFWYYCGTQLKEVEMVFLGMLFVEQADQMLRSRQFTMWKIAPLLLIAAALFTVRTPLAIVCVLALLFTIFMSSSRVVGWGKRIIIGVLAVGLIGFTMGNRIQEEAQGLLQKVQSNEQQTNMEWRTRRSNGNQFAKYASATVFAPMIFTIPFPTLIYTPNQDAQQIVNGGNFCKNIFSFFVILSMVMLLMSGRWREHMLPLSYLLGYLVVLMMSVFAQSERFHQPAMPMALMFAAYGIQQALIGVPVVQGLGSRAMYRRWFTIWVGVMFVACVAWSWFKMAGRGL